MALFPFWMAAFYGLSPGVRRLWMPICCLNAPIVGREIDGGEKRRFLNISAKIGGQKSSPAVYTDEDGIEQPLASFCGRGDCIS